MENKMKRRMKLSVLFAMALMVAACGGGGGGGSDTASPSNPGNTGANGGSGTGGDAISPSTPTNITATLTSKNAITLHWDASTDNVAVTSYNIYRQQGFNSGSSANSSLVKNQPGNSFVDVGLQPGIYYCYTVSASDSAGNESGRTWFGCALTQGATITVNVVDSLAHVAGVNVYLKRASDHSQVTTGALDATAYGITGSDGIAVIKDVPNGEYILFTVPPTAYRVVSFDVPVSIKDNDATATILLARN